MHFQPRHSLCLEKPGNRFSMVLCRRNCIATPALSLCQAWMKTAWAKCLSRDPKTTFVSVWTDAGYRCLALHFRAFHQALEF